MIYVVIMIGFVFTMVAFVAGCEAVTYLCWNMKRRMRKRRKEVCTR